MPFRYAIVLFCLIALLGCEKDNATETTVSDATASTQADSTETPSTEAEDASENEEEVTESAEDTVEEEEEAEPVVQYLQGTSTTTSPDGNIVYEEVDVLAKRTMDFAAGSIVEDTLHGDELRKTFFTQQPGTLIFDVTDEEGTFSGTVVFETEDWAGSNVTYDFELFGDFPGTLTGTGVWEGDTYTTDKEFANEAGVLEAKIEEVLTVISEEDYNGALSP